MVAAGHRLGHVPRWVSRWVRLASEEVMVVAMTLGIEELRAALWDYRAPEVIGRHELTNEQWQLIRELFPRPATRRGNPRHPRRLLDGMLWILRTGAPWRDLPRDRYGPWKTVWRKFDEWRREGRLDLVKRRLLLRLNQAGELDWDLWCVDGTSVRASRCAVGGGRGGTLVNPITMHQDARQAAGERRSTS